ncbi:MAG: UbiD family decarboxylase [Chloroflexi bacterium]|nr:UbiD family decarboxylase [Chloroflexota bacterium]
MDKAGLHQACAQDLRDWIRRVDELGELRRVVGATWQEDIGLAGDVLNHSSKAPAVVFDRIPGYPEGHRVIVNCFGSLRRIALTLGLPVDANPQELVGLWQQKLAQIVPIPPVFVSDAPVMENVHERGDVDVLAFPVPKWHEFDGGRYIGTRSCDITRDPDEGWVNAGTYRVVVHDAKRVGFYISPGKHGRIHREKFFSRGEPCPVAVAIGADPVLLLAASAEVPYGLSEYDWAGGIKGEPIRVTTGKVTGLPIPVDAEIVLEGFASPQDCLLEGPFGEFTGYYASASRQEPVIEIEAIYHRNDPIISGIQISKPPDEHALCEAFLRSAVIREALEGAGVPDVAGVWSHIGAGSFFIAVGIKQRYPGHARQAGHVAAMCRGAAYMGRYVVVVDEDIDVTDLNEVVWAMCTRADPAGAIDIIHRAWSGPLDPAIHPDHKGFNSRAIIDACRPYEWKDRFPPVNQPSPEVRRKAMEKWGYLIGE